MDSCLPAMMSINFGSIIGMFCTYFVKHNLPPSTLTEAISRATMGSRGASRFVEVDMLKGLCDFFGVDVPLIENDCLDKNEEINEEVFDEYLMQEDDDDNDERKEKALFALINMILGQRIKGQR